MSKYIFEIDYVNIPKAGQSVSGDVFLVTKTKGKRYIATLSDGLGSGVKANILATLTASMLQKFMKEHYSPPKAAQTIVETLPICSKRKIAYATYTNIVINPDGKLKILEYDNPEIILIRNNSEIVSLDKKEIKIQTSHTRNTILYSVTELQPGDRLVFFSDGVEQSGIGYPKYPMGWEIDNIKKFILDTLKFYPNISAKNLAKFIVDEAHANDNSRAHDDITSASVYYRKARELLIITGPPGNKKNDKYIVDKFINFEGKKIISGGTTANIISKALGEEVEIDMSDISSDVPPKGKMKSADLVTEGMLTLNKVVKLLSSDNFDPSQGDDAAYLLANYLLISDIIYFVVGTAINPAHQNPDLPIELGLRRITIKELAKILEQKYFKEVYIEYV